jgi:hypothetical protein
VKSLYVVVNFRGVLPAYVQNVWKIETPPNIHFFLWLLFHNSILTRDNLVKRQNVDDLTCVFCNEPGTCTHFLLECMVARAIWQEILHLTRLGCS